MALSLSPNLLRWQRLITLLETHSPVAMPVSLIVQAGNCVAGGQRISEANSPLAAPVPPCRPRFQPTRLTMTALSKI